MTESIQVHVGESLEAMGQRFVDAWHRAERGEAVHESHLSFESWETLTRTLTGGRLELLRHLHRHPAVSIAELARALGRDDERVCEDVEALAEVGLIDRTEDGVRADYDEIRTTIAL